MKRTLICDLDGTALKCGRYYSEAGDKVAAKVGEKFEVEPALVRELLVWLDLWAIRAGMGFSRDRFPQVLGAAALAVGVIKADNAIPLFATECCRIADSVFTAEYEPYEGAIETLKAYRENGWQVVLYTKGDQEVQQYKIDRHGLASVVDAVEIVDKKDEKGLRNLIEKYEIDVPSSAYVGDSIRDDMIPASRLGLFAVRVETQPEDNTWHREVLEDQVSDRVVPALADLPVVLSLHGEALEVESER